ncbi:MAG: PASTA domain-containing protein [Wujia sp.]
MNYPMTLEQYIGQRPMREIDLVHMGSQIAGALSVIHQQGRVHGDVKPGNILVLGDGKYQLIGMEPVRKYPEGMIPAYIAPELSQGADYRPGIDVYSLGMMMRSLEPRNEEVSTVLKEIIQKACEPDPGKRYASALEFANELEMMYEVMLQTQPLQIVNRQDPNMGQMNPNMNRPGPNMGQMNPNMNRPGPNMGQMNPNMNRPGPNMGQMNPNMNRPGPNMGQMNPNMNRPGPNMGQQSQGQSQRPVQSKQDHAKKEKEASVALRFILPILIVLVVAAAVVAYVVLIRPALNDKDKNETTQGVTTTESTTENTTTETTTEGTKTCVVPDTEGLSEEAAKSQLEALNLKVAVKYDISDTVEEGQVISQSVASGTTVVEQTEVVITVSEGNGCPYEYSQKVTVSANPGSTSGTLTLYNWENGDWVSKFSCPCVVGKNGIGSDYGEGRGVTPLGTFKLGFVLGTVDPNNNMVFKQASSTTAIVDDTSSSLYNTIVDTSQVSGISVDHVGENIVSGKLSCVIFIEHNGNGITSENVVSGKGSVITICGNNRSISSTAGCIDINASDMSTLLSYLDGTKNPYIETKLN